MEKSADVNTIVNIIKELVRGYYGIVYRDTISYNIQKFDKDEFTNLLKSNKDKWVIECDGDLTRFILTDSSDPTATNSDILKTFNAYEFNGCIRIASISVVCDWSIFELAFNGEQPQEVLNKVK